MLSSKLWKLGGYDVLVGVGETKGLTAKVLGEALLLAEEQVERTERPLHHPAKG